MCIGCNYEIRGGYWNEPSCMRSHCKKADEFNEDDVKEYALENMEDFLEGGKLCNQSLLESFCDYREIPYSWPDRWVDAVREAYQEYLEEVK